MTEQPGISLQAQIECVEREIKMRERVYPGLVRTKKMASATAQYETDAMRAVLATLKAIQEPGLI